jgi:hypothetical protein
MPHGPRSSKCATVGAEPDPARDAIYNDFYLPAVRALDEAGLPFLVGGAYAFERVTGIERDLKDFDIFVRPEDCQRVLDKLAAIGYQTELTFSHWLGKAVCGKHYIDVIFNSGNGIARVDDDWFKYAIIEDFFGIPIKLCPLEETIWSKAFVMERERYDGADVAHLFLSSGHEIDWSRLIRRFGIHWRLLLSHIILFGFAYPSERSRIPEWVIDDLLQKLRGEIDSQSPSERICQGTLLSREQYLPDVEHGDYEDARIAPRGNMTKAETDQWTAAIGKNK